MCTGDILVCRRYQNISAKGKPRLSVQCSQAVDIELDLHSLQKVRTQSLEQLWSLQA